MTKTFKWETPKGAKMEMTVSIERVTSEVINADGHEIECSCDRWERRVESCKINGTDTGRKELGIVCGVRAVLIGRSGKQDIAAALPADVVDAIYGDEARANEEKLERAIALEKKVEAEREMMRKVMGY